MLCFFALFWFLCKMPATIFFFFFFYSIFRVHFGHSQSVHKLIDRLWNGARFNGLWFVCVCSVLVFAVFGEYPDQLGWSSCWDVLERTSYTTFHTNENFWMPVLLCNPSTLSWRVFVVSHVSAVWSHSSFVLGFLFTCEDGWFRLVGWWAMVCRRFKKSNIEGWVGADAPEMKKNAHYNLPLKYHPDKT